MSDEELKSLFEVWRQENNAAHAETQRRLDSLDKKIDTVDHRVDSLDRRFDSLDSKFDGLDKKVDTLSSDVRRLELITEQTRDEIRIVAESVSQTNERLTPEMSDVREEMRRGFADTQAMIKFSHAELDRRVRALEDSHRSLEETLADLQVRVERLETSTH